MSLIFDCSDVRLLLLLECFPYIAYMYIRQTKKQRSKDSKVFYQYSLAQTVRVAGKVKQKVILYMGSAPLMADEENRKQVLEILKAKIFKQDGLFPEQVSKEVLALAMSYFEKYCIKYGEEGLGGASIPPPPEKASFHNIDLEGIQAEQVHTFGGEHLCKQVLEKLELGQFLDSLGFTGKQKLRALISIAARALFACSEHKTAQILQSNSSLTDCFHYEEALDHRKLYAAADQLYAHKKQIDAFLHRRTNSMFGLQDKLVIFDISNTYFETGKQGSRLAKYGRSKEKRTDCPLAVFTGVVNAEGFIRHSHVYEGNTADTATLADMLDALQEHTGQGGKKTVVMDAGIATEENLELVKKMGHHYVCVSRHRLKDYPGGQPETAVVPHGHGQGGITLRCFRPEGYNDTWMYVQSPAKKAKEQSMDQKLKQRYIEELEGIAAALHKKGGTKSIEKVWERIGRAKERNKRVSAHFYIELESHEGKATAMKWQEKQQTKKQHDKAEGVYFIRTSYTQADEKQLWQTYNTIREVEATFRCLKSDLQIRPIHHQNDLRVEAHIYLTMLAYQLVNTIRHMLKDKNILHDWKNITRIMSTQTIQTIVLPTDKKTIHLRKPSKPIKEAQQIYQATACTHTQKPIKKYVVYH